MSKRLLFTNHYKEGGQTFVSAVRSFCCAMRQLAHEPACAVLRRCPTMMKTTTLLIILASPSLAQTQPSMSRPIVFTHVTVVNVTAIDINHALQPDQTVVIRGNRISSVAEARSAHIPADAQIIDATGKFLMPGLWDMHVHIGGAWNVATGLNLFLANGITGIRDMGSGLKFILDLRQQIASDSLLGPRLVVAGRYIDGPRGSNDRNAHAVRNAEQARAAVRLRKQAGVDFVKLYSYLSPEAFFAALDEANKQGLTAVGHVPWGVKASEAAKAGLKSIEHAEGVAIESSDIEDVLRDEIVARLREGKRTSVPEIEVDQGPRYRDSYNPHRQEQLNATFVKYGTWHSPTLVVSDFLSSWPNSVLGKYAANGFDEFPYVQYVPKARRANFKRNLSRRWSADPLSDPEVYTANKRALVIAMHRAGVRFLAATDAPGYGVPGFSLHDELVLLTQAGLSPLDALQAATINPARFLGNEKEMGSVERDKLADLVLVEANPVEDIANTRRICAVVANGRYLPKDALQNMLDDVAAMAGKESIAEAVFATIQEQGIAPALEQYHQLREQHSATYQLNEGEMNGVGYRLLGMKKVKEAIELFNLNVEAFPRSSDVYDSLGEAYMADGNTQLAIENYQKSIASDPENLNGVEILKRLRAK